MDYQMPDNNGFSEKMYKWLHDRVPSELPFPPVSLYDEALYMRIASKFLCPTYHLDYPHMAWYKSPEITEFVKHFPIDWEMFNLGRRYNLLQLLQLAKNVPGDSAECGVFRGSSSWLILRHLLPYKGMLREHHIFDSFEGLSAPGPDDGEDMRKGECAHPLEQVQQKLAQFGDRCFYHKGWIPDRFKDVKDKKFSFVHVDVDLYQPTLDSIKFFYPRLNKGGILVCDDYNFTTCPGATLAMKEYFVDKPESLIAMSAGGCWLMKVD